MNEGFMKFNALRLEKYCRQLKRKQANLYKKIESLKKELFNNVNHLESVNKNKLQRKEEKIVELKEQIKQQQEEEKFYKTKLEKVPKFILKKYMVNN